MHHHTIPANPHRHCVGRSAVAIATAIMLIMGALTPASTTASMPILQSLTGDDGSGHAQSAEAWTVHRLFGLVFTLQMGELCPELMTSDARTQTPFGRYVGPDEFETFAGTLWTAFPDARFTIDDLEESRNSVTVRWTMIGTHAGTLETLAPSGRHVELHGLALFRFENGRITESWIEFDRLWLIQLLTEADHKPTCPTCWVLASRDARVVASGPLREFARVRSWPRPLRPRP